MKGKGQFQKVLNIDYNEIGKLLSCNNYRVWRNSDGRVIQQPISWLAKVHKRIANLLNRIELPDYIYSQLGRSYSDNARVHVGETPLVKTDIHKFFPSTTRNMVYKMFRNEFQCALDISNVLADICCYKQSHLPTGSPLSGRVAFFAAKNMFDEIMGYVSKYDCMLSVYVDDITVSGKNATKQLLGEVRKIISKHGYLTKQRKSFTYPESKPKQVTGTIVTSDDLRLPNQRHKKIWETRKQIKVADPVEKDRLMKSLQGRIQESKQITKKSQY
ncbi:MAG: reverse transcriptase family protein [Candidatus Thiodiazotropha sp. (ex. Lucinisca nassula)]|nr:reverse transcriptase family protein [Candidatus Thiodiazotropha sp. (ex. Lucinisca nassula)]MBW9275652.1 reverse transcriptase family protein [Candidatus Thiodiazotropha sp. (ex. Lucinisca nassula)]